MQQTIHSSHDHEKEYDSYLEQMSLPEESLYTTDVDLWPIYLDSFADPETRQYHNCHCCKQFIQRFGNLVTIDPVTGETQSAVWNVAHVLSFYEPAIVAMKYAVEKAQVTGVFLSSDKTLGTPVTGEWVHFSVQNPSVYRRGRLTAEQAAAEKKEDYRNISRALAEFELGTLEQVTELLESDTLYRSEKVLGQATWLYNLKKAVTTTRHQMCRKNLIWKAVGDAPAGFCHPRTSMIGTLLEDLEAGLAFDDAARKFASKMHPLRYQRPTAAPSAGAIEEAEKMVKELGLERSLERRFATFDDMQFYWKPVAQQEEKSGGVFDHLKENRKQLIVAKGGALTWVKFAADVLPKAKKIEVIVSHGRSSFVTFVTAQYEDAPLIFQWDNPVSWYHWHGGTTPAQFGLQPGAVEIEGICLPSYMWSEDSPPSHFGKNVMFILKGARETRNEGNALFPETLRSDFHGIRKVVEAHSRKSRIHDIDGPHVVGKGLGTTIRVHTSVVTEYLIDRWD